MQQDEISVLIHTSKCLYCPLSFTFPQTAVWFVWDRNYQCSDNDAAVGGKHSVEAAGDEADDWCQ